MTEDKKLKLYRALGVAVIAAVTIASASLAPQYPWVAACASVISWYVGKLLGIPTDEIIAVALRSKPPAAVADLAVKAITSMTPDDKVTATARIIESIRPAARPTGQVVRPISFVGADDDDKPRSER